MTAKEYFGEKVKYKKALEVIENMILVANGPAIREVYKDMPELLDEVLNWFRRHWKGTK